MESRMYVFSKRRYRKGDEFLLRDRKWFFGQEKIQNGFFFS